MPGTRVVKVTARCQGIEHYCPELGLVTFLDAEYPASAPHCVYAYYARAFTVPALKTLYERLCDEHEVDAIVAVDGGSDSLMAGDESGLGDPIEDAVSVATIATMTPSRRPLLSRLLVAIGVGCDRFNGVSDAATLRAMAELTAAGGSRGAMLLEPTSPLVQAYRRFTETANNLHSFRSLINTTVLEASYGAYGSEKVPEPLLLRVRPGQLFIWPLMAMHFAFTIQSVFQRNLYAVKLLSCRSVEESYVALATFRQSLKKGRRRGVEQLPSQKEW